MREQRVLERFARTIERRATGPLFQRRGPARQASPVSSSIAQAAIAHTRPVGTGSKRMFMVGIDRVDDPATEVW